MDFIIFMVNVNFQSCLGFILGFFYDGKVKFFYLYKLLRVYRGILNRLLIGQYGVGLVFEENFNQ